MSWHNLVEVMTKRSTTKASSQQVPENLTTAQHISAISDTEDIDELAKMLILDVKTRWSLTHQMMGKFFLL
jgi:hypothetical protein